MDGTVSLYTTDASKLWVSFDAPENTRVVLQPVVQDLFLTWQNSGDDADYEAFMEALHEQLADHIAAYTFIRDWDYA